VLIDFKKNDLFYFYKRTFKFGYIKNGWVYFSNAWLKTVPNIKAEMIYTLKAQK